MVEKLQHKTRTYKKQIEDAEEIAALNLAKFRKAQQQLEEVINIQGYTLNITNMTLGRGQEQHGRDQHRKDQSWIPGGSAKK